MAAPQLASQGLSLRPCCSSGLTPSPIALTIPPMSLLQEGIRSEGFQRLFPELVDLAEREPAFVQGVWEGINQLVNRANAIGSDDPLLEIMPALRKLRQGQDYPPRKCAELPTIEDFILDKEFQWLRSGIKHTISLIRENVIQSPLLRTSDHARLASALAHFYEQTALMFLRLTDDAQKTKDIILTPLCEVAMLLKAEGRENSLHGFIFSPLSSEAQGGLGWERPATLERFLLSYQLLQFEQKVDPLEDPRVTRTLLGYPVEFGETITTPGLSVLPLKISGLEGFVGGYLFSVSGTGPGPEIVSDHLPEDRNGWFLTEPFYKRRVVEYFVEGEAKVLTTELKGKMVETKIVKAADRQIIRLPEATILAYINVGEGPVIGISLSFPATAARHPISRRDPAIPLSFLDSLSQEESKTKVK